MPPKIGLNKLRYQHCVAAMDITMDYEIFEVIAWLIFIWGLLRLLKRKKK
jgi:hypothetical protein